MTGGAVTIETPLISSPGVCLRPFAEADLPVVLRAAEDPYVRLLTGLVAGDREHALRYLARQGLRAERGLGVSWAMADPTGDRAVGQVGLWMRAVAPDGTTGYLEEAHGRAALGYWVVPGERRRGFARAALAAASSWALARDDIDRLELFVEPDNVASCRTAEAVGYRREGLLRRYQSLAGVRRDMLVYALLGE